MPKKREWLILAAIVGVFLAAWFVPVQWGGFYGPVEEALRLAQSYAREHVLLCLVPAMFIAGGIGAFVSQASVMKYLGARANKGLAYGVAGVSGTVLAVCSCTVLPLFAGIYRMGAGLGPAAAFLYAGPAINVLAMVLTARVLGLELGVARAVGAVGFSIIIGLLMHLIFRKAELTRADAQAHSPAPPVPRPLWKTAAFFAAMVGVLVFLNWSVTGEYRGLLRCCPAGEQVTSVVEGRIVAETSDAVTFRDKAGAEKVVPRWELSLLEPAHGELYMAIHRWRLVITGVLGLALAAMVARWFRRQEVAEWLGGTWGFTKQILPLLLAGVLVSGFLLGGPQSGPGHEGIVPTGWIASAVGGNSLRANLIASVAGALMYFATLTEVPIVQGLINAGMGKGPSLALLLAGPALSLPSMVVLVGIMGWRRTVVYCLLVVVMAAATGMLFGAAF